MNYLAITGLFGATTSILLGVFVYCKNPTKMQNKAYFGISFSVFIYGIAYFFWQISTNEVSASSFFRVLTIGIILINYFYLLYVFVFLDILKREKKFLFINGLICCFFLFLLLTNKLYNPLVWKSNVGFWPVANYLSTVYILFWHFQAIYGIWSLFLAFKRADSLKKLQIKYFAIAAAIGYLGGASNWPMWYGRLPYSPYLNILITIFVCIVAYAIVRHKLLDIEVIVKKTLVFAGLFLVSYAVFASFAYLGSTFLEGIVDNRWIAMMPAVLIVVLMLRPVEAFLRNVTDKYLFQKKYDYKQLLKTFTGEVLTVIDLKELAYLTVDKLVEIIKLENASILLYNEDSAELRLVVSSGMQLKREDVEKNKKFISYLRENKKHVMLEDPEHKEVISGDLKEKITALNAELVIPLFNGQDMVGILFLGKKKSDEEFTQDDIDILLPLAKTLSIAISNARLFEKLSVAQAQAAQREKMAVIGTLSAGINHEICNPLGIARGQCEMFLLNLHEGLYKDKSTEELLEKAKEIMHKVINETDRATIITKKLSSFAKPSKGEIVHDVHVDKEIDQVISLIEHDLKLENIDIRKEINEKLPCIAADRKQLQEIFFNIIRNAAQSIEGRGAITVRAFTNNQRVYVDIVDSGAGINKENLGRIFDPFFTTKDPGKGTGLGLFLVKQIIERNSGTISCTSEKGKGTTFHLSFPPADPNEAAEPTKQAGFYVRGES